TFTAKHDATSLDNISTECQSRIPRPSKSFQPSILEIIEGKDAGQQLIADVRMRKRSPQKKTDPLLSERESVER
ncbi:MAG: hypothetical protein AAFV25_09340, partial [Bacteroidota bacterium]